MAQVSCVRMVQCIADMAYWIWQDGIESPELTGDQLAIVRREWDRWRRDTANDPDCYQLSPAEEEVAFGVFARTLCGNGLDDSGIAREARLFAANLGKELVDSENKAAAETWWEELDLGTKARLLASQLTEVSEPMSKLK